MEEQIVAIQNQGLDATIEYLKENLPEYENAWSISKNNIQSEWEFLYGVVDGTITEIQSRIPDFTDLLTQLREAANLVSQINMGSSNGGTQTTINNPSPPPPPPPPVVNASQTTKTEWGLWRNLSSTQEIRDLYQITYDAKGNEINRQVVDTETRRKTQTNSGSSGSKYVPVMQAYASGGLASFTGPAWLDGTPSKPERILSPVQTELFDKMVSNLESLRAYNTTNNAIVGASSAVNVANVAITVGNLETDQQFMDAGMAFAKELKAAIKERGLNINKKR